MRAVILCLLLWCGLAHAQTEPAPAVPECWPTVRCANLDGPHVRMGREGIHLIWSGEWPAGSERKVTAMSCRWDRCSEAAWNAVMKALTDASTAGQATRLQILRRAWTSDVTQNCDFLAAVPFTSIPDERLLDWLMCREQKAFVGLIYPK